MLNYLIAPSIKTTNLFNLGFLCPTSLCEEKTERKMELWLRVILPMKLCFGFQTAPAWEQRGGSKVQSKVQLCKWWCGVDGTMGRGGLGDKSQEQAKRANVAWKIIHINIQRKYRITVVITQRRGSIQRQLRESVRACMCDCACRHCLVKSGFILCVWTGEERVITLYTWELEGRLNMWQTEPVTFGQGTQLLCHVAR